MLELIEARSKVVPGKIGVLVPISGKLKAYGENALQAVKLASGQMNAAKPDTRFEFVVRDSKGDPAAAAQAVQDFVTVDGVVAVFGALFRVEAESAATKAQELGVPLLSLTAAEDITETGPFVFRNGLTSSAQMDALVEYAMDVLGMKRFSILYPKHPYGEAMLHLFWDRVEARRGEVSGVESYGANDTTFTGPVKRLVGRSRLDLRSDYRLAKRECEKQPDSYRKARCVRELDASIKPIVDFDGLFIPDYPRSLALITPALAAEDIVVERDERYIRRIERTLGRTVKPVTLLGASGWNSNELPEKAGRYVENAIFIDGFFADSESKEVRSFVDAFRREFKRTPGLPEAQFYDAARLMKEVVLKEMPTTREAMRQALRKVHDFPGVTGKTSLVESNEAKRKVSVLTIKEGRIIEAPPPSEQAPSVPATPAGAPPAG
jgi:ABC-type branched-subunit amino acid transport system substrate-binding protein